MAFTKNPLQDGTKTKLSDYSNDLENRIGTAVNPIVQTYTALSPVTGTFRAIRIGDLVYLMGDVTPSAGGDRVQYLHEQFRPKGSSVVITTPDGNIQINTNGAFTSYQGSKRLFLNGISYYVGD